MNWRGIVFYLAAAVFATPPALLCVIALLLR
jgi:hypothetical protein